MMKKEVHCFLVTMLFLILPFLQIRAQIPDLVNPNATQKAKDVYMYIYNARDHGLITGQHNYSRTWDPKEDIAIRATNAVKEATGHYPGLWGSDFTFANPDNTIEQLQHTRQQMIDIAKAQADAGSLITLTYHMVVPTMEENQGWNNVKDPRLTMAEYKELITPGTDLFNNWKRNMDRIIPFLKQLQEEDYAVIWRPYHEMNGLFWWGGKHKDEQEDPSKIYFNQLWINTYNYMVHDHGLNNLIWFWSPNHFTSWDNDRVPDPWFPGHEYVDMLGIDDYWWRQEGFLSQGDYDYLVEKAQGKPLAIGEGFNVNMVLPSIEWLREHRPEYRWFMIWDGRWIDERLEDPEKRAELKAIYDHENAINQAKVHILLQK
jgi:mannan endo-1,4-beta-mannosidase